MKRYCVEYGGPAPGRTWRWKPGACYRSRRHAQRAAQKLKRRAPGYKKIRIVEVDL